LAVQSPDAQVAIGSAGRDLIAACALIAVAVPEQIATAGLAGAPPSFGLVVFVAGSLGFFLLGSNRYLSTGADSTIAPIFAAGLSLFAATGSQHYLALAPLLAAMVGVTVGLTGLLRLGWIARLLSLPVITGLLAGIGIHIAVSQLPALLGLPAGQGAPAQTIAAVLADLGRIKIFALLIGIGVFAVVTVCERLHVRLPGALIAMVLAALATGLFGLDRTGVSVLGQVPAPSLWPLAMDVVPADMIALIPIALLISLIVVIQTVTVARSFPDEGAPDINRDLIGVGFGNVLSGLSGGFPANSSPPRTAIAHENGAATRLAGLFAALGVAVCLIFGRDLLADIPKPALAGLLLFVAWRLFRVDMMRKIWSQSRTEFYLLVATAIAIVTLPIELGVTLGIGLSLLHGVWTITQTGAVIFEQVPGTTVWWPSPTSQPDHRQSGIVVVGFQAPLFFLNAETFRKTVIKIIDAAPRPVLAIVLEGSSIVEIDFSGAQILIELIEHLNGRGIAFYIARLESVRAQQALATFGIASTLGDGKVFHSVDDAIKHIGAPASSAVTR
jgi:sulfate permease, SulP family